MYIVRKSKNREVVSMYISHMKSKYLSRSLHCDEKYVFVKKLFFHTVVRISGHMKTMNNIKDTLNLFEIFRE